MRRSAVVALRQRRFAPILTAVFVAALAYWAVTHRTSAHARAAIVSVYGPHPGQYAEWDGPGASYTPAQVAKLARNVTYVVITNSNKAVGIASDFRDATSLAAAAKRFGNTSLRPLAAFDATFLYRTALSLWRPYTDTFYPAWYLRDTSGHTLPFRSGTTPLGDVYDLTNPAYRAWATNVIVSWMKAAPYKGVVLDVAIPLQGNKVWHDVGNGLRTPNDLLCGPRAPVDRSGNCAKVYAWNKGMATFIAELTQHLKLLGDQVMINGITIAPGASNNRSVGLIDYADGASDENFCYREEESVANTDKLVFESVIDVRPCHATRGGCRQARHRDY